MKLNQGLSASGHAERMLQPQRAAADRIMLSMMVFLLAVCLSVGWFTDSTSLSLLVGLPTLLVPWAIYKMAPGSLASRLAIACALMVFSALTIQQTQGMVESHFGIFTLLAFLLYYRDWRPIVAAAGLIAVHHVGFGYLQLMNTGGITLLAGFASTVGWPLSAWIAHTWGWREACATWAVLHLVLGLPLNASLPRTETGKLQRFRLRQEAAS